MAFARLLVPLTPLLFVVVGFANNVFINFVPSKPDFDVYAFQAKGCLNIFQQRISCEASHTRVSLDSKLFNWQCWQ